MAIYHFSAQTISRSQGRSAVGCSAYRSASELFDEYYGKTHDYTQKEDVAFTEIMLPKDAPLGLSDREKLWNAVEANERRKDAQLAREIQVSLPRELTLEQNTQLIKEFVQKEFVDKGMIADLAIHIDKSSDGELQPHAHVMLTMREVTLEGFGQKNREWNSKEYLMMWREHWAEVTNRYLALNGYDITIDHRSNKVRGIDLTPQHKIGTTVSRHQLDRMADHNRIAFENGEKIFENPQIALDALTYQQSTFTHQDLARFINRHTNDAEQFSRVYEKVCLSEHLVYLGKDDKDRERFTTIEMLAIEKSLIRRSEELNSNLKHNVYISSYFKGLDNRQLSDEQRIAYDHLLEKGDLKCVVGIAGSGKSYLLGAAREAFKDSGYRVLGATLAGIAAENLTASSGIESRTIASLMYYWERGEELLSDKDILVIDEAGMIGSRQMEQVLKHVQEAGAKAILIGDPQQLQAIEAGAAFRAIVERVGFIELTEVRRQIYEWQRQATKEFARGNIEDGLIKYKVHENVHEFETEAYAKKAMVELWNDARITKSDKTQIMLSYTRKDAAELNEMAREMRQRLGELGESHVLSTVKGDKEFAENDRIYFLKNDRDLGVKNGSLGSIERIDKNENNLIIRLDKENKGNKEHIGHTEHKREAQGIYVKVNLEKYNHIDYGYAATIHKAQGVTVDRTYLLASKHMDGHATYVAMSRHRQSADLFYSKEEFNHERALIEILGRERAKDISIDYSHERFKDKFASCRNIEDIKVSETLVKELERNAFIEKERESIRSTEKERWVERDVEVEMQIGKEGKGAEEKRMEGIAIEKQREGKDKNINQEMRLESKGNGKIDKEQSSLISQIREQQRKQDWQELMKFKEDYERRHPQAASRLTEELLPDSEKRVIAVEKEIRELKEQIKRDPLALLAKKELNALILKVTKDKELMQDLKERAPGLSAQIIIKAKELERDRNRCRSR